MMSSSVSSGITDSQLHFWYFRFYAHIEIRHPSNKQRHEFQDTVKGHCTSTDVLLLITLAKATEPPSKVVLCYFLIE